MSVTVNRASKITASQWVAMIQKSTHIPSHISKHFRAKDNVITGPRKIKQPANTTPKEWPDDLVAAFESNEWEMTTASARFDVVKEAAGYRVKRKLSLDLQNRELGPGFWFNAGPGQRQWSPNTRIYNESYQVGEIALQFGETLDSADLKSKRQKLIFVINRVHVFGLKPDGLLSAFMPLSGYFGVDREVKIPETRLLSTFFHELAAHAGRMHLGKNAEHKNLLVELSVEEIEALFPKDTALEQIANAVRAAASHLQERDSGVKAGRAPGPVTGPSAGARTPGPLR